MLLTRALTRALLAAALLVPFTVHAQGPTPEGTKITNTAKVSFTDANGNTYDEVSATVEITVGFKAGVTATADPTGMSPASPSTGNQFLVTLENVGNGKDTITVSAATDAGLTITGYKYGSNSYTNIDDLNAALKGVELDMGGTLTFTVIYRVGTGLGGMSPKITVTGISTRTPAEHNDAIMTVTPPVTYGVEVTPDSTMLKQLPTKDFQTYTFDFFVKNSSSKQETFDINAVTQGLGRVTIVTINGGAGPITIPIAADSTKKITVEYRVADAAGSSETITLTATAQSEASTTNSGVLTIEVVKPALSITKEAYRDNPVTLITAADSVRPGEYIRYKITVQNDGGGAATSVKITDQLPTQVTYDSVIADVDADWTVNRAGSTVTADLTGALAAGASRFIWVRVKIN
jgi:uncharacterized repeat protein (TIGR01451 family)